MSRRFPVISVFYAVIVLFLVTAGFYGIRQLLSDEDRLLLEFKSELLSHDYRSMYRSSSDLTRLNVKEDEFVRRMQIVEQILNEYDPDQNFMRDIPAENSIKEVRRLSEPDNPQDESQRFVIVKLGPEQHRAVIIIDWYRDWFKPRLMDLSIGDDGVSVTNRVMTIAGLPFQPGEKQ